MDSKTPYIDIHTHHHASIDGIHRVVSVMLDDVLHPGNIPETGSVGVHPWYAAGRSPAQVAADLSVVAAQPWCIAVGEIGLDRVKGPELEIQRAMFEAQLDVASELDMPVILHCVRAHADMMQLRKQRGDRQPWILHGFTGHAELAGQMLDLGFHLSFGTVLLEIGSKARAALRSVPPERVFLETDESSVEIQRVYRAAADLLKRPEEDLRETIAANYRRCFGETA